MSRVQLVLSETRNDEGGKPLEAAGEQSEDVEGRFVGPVHVLENQDPRLVRPSSWTRPQRRRVAGLRLRAHAAARRRDAWPTSRKGPSGRGVKSESQAPQVMCAVGAQSSQNLRITVVFPTPASPATMTILPLPPAASESAPRRASRFASRSRNKAFDSMETTAIR